MISLLFLRLRGQCQKANTLPDRSRWHIDNDAGWQRCLGGGGPRCLGGLHAFMRNATAPIASVPSALLSAWRWACRVSVLRRCSSTSSPKPSSRTARPSRTGGAPRHTGGGSNVAACARPSHLKYGSSTRSRCAHGPRQNTLHVHGNLTAVHLKSPLDPPRRRVHFSPAVVSYSSSASSGDTSSVRPYGNQSSIDGAALPLSAVRLILDGLLSAARRVRGA